MKKTLLFSLAAGALIAGATAATQIATRSGDVQQIDVTFSPASGTTVTAISEITIQLPASELNMQPNGSRIDEIILTNEDTDEVIKASEWGEPGQSTDGAYFNYPVKFATTITAEGTYTLSVPQGVIREMEEVDGDIEPKLGGAQNKAATATYTIAGDAPSLLADYALDPASGETVTEIDYIQILFKDLQYSSPLWNTDNEKGFTITDGETVYYGNGQVDEEYMEEEGLAFKLFFYANEERSGEKVIINQAGTWTLHLAEGVFNLKGDLSPEITATYTIEGGEPEVKTAKLSGVVPANGAEVPSISEITVKSGMDPLLLPVLDKASEITLTKEGSTTPIKAKSFGDAESADGVTVDIPVIFEEITEAGTYTLSIPQGVFAESNENFETIPGGAVNEAFTSTIIISANAATKFDTYTFGPVEKVGILKSATLTFDQYTAMSYYVMPAEDAEEATISNGEKTYKAEATLNDDNWDEREYIFTFFDENEERVMISESGTWTLTIPEGYFEDTQNHTASKAMEAKFTVDSSIVPEITWTADPENGGKAAITGYLQTVTFTFNGAESVSYTPVDELAGIRITYNGENLKPVDVVFGDDAEYGYQLYNNYGENTAVIRISPAVLNSVLGDENVPIPGILKISIDEGRFTIDGAASPAIEYSCTFGDYKEFTYTLTPDGSETVNSLAEFTLTFPNATTATMDEDNLDVTLSQGQAYAFPGYPVVTEVKDAEHPTFKISFNFTEEALKSLKAGNYTLTIFEGSFKLDGGQPSPEIRQTYTYKSDKPVDWTLIKSPDMDDAIVYYNEWDKYYFTEIGVAFAENESYSRGDNFSAIKLELDGVAIAAGSEAGETPVYTTGFSSDSNVLYFDIMSLGAFTGTIKLTIPAGAIKLTGEPNAEDIVFTWNAVAPKTYTYTLTPDGSEPVSSLEQITVAFPEAATGELWNQGFIQFKDRNYNWVWVKTVETVEGTGCATFKITFDTKDATEEGIYTLTIREECFTLDGSQASPAIEQAYTYKKGSGLAMIPADADGKYTVYTLDGKVVLDKASAAGLSNLEKGIYIINGKKIAIK